jgi:hypothetical protein
MIQRSLLRVQVLIWILLLTLVNHNAQCSCWIENELPSNRSGCLWVSCRAADQSGPSSNDINRLDSPERYDCVEGSCEDWNENNECESTSVHLCPKKTTSPTPSPFLPRSTLDMPKIRPFMPAVAAMLFFCGVLLLMALVMCVMVICIGVKHFMFGTNPNSHHNNSHHNPPYEAIPEVIFCLDLADTDDTTEEDGWDL